MTDDGGPRLPTDFDAWMAAEFNGRPPKVPRMHRSRRSLRREQLETWRPAPARRRGWWVWIAVVAVVAALVGVSLAFPSAHPTPTRATTAGRGPRFTPPPAPVPGGPMPTVDALFPLHVSAPLSSYDRIATLTSDHCLHNDAIPAELAAAIQDLGGCVGARFALYVDSARHALITVGAITMADPTAVVEILPDGDPSDTIGMLPLPAGSTLRPRAGVPPILGDAAVSAGDMVVGVGTPTTGVKPDYGRLSEQIRELTARISLRFLTIPGTAAATATI